MLEKTYKKMQGYGYLKTHFGNYVLVEPFPKKLDDWQGEEQDTFRVVPEYTENGVHYAKDRLVVVEKVNYLVELFAFTKPVMVWDGEYVEVPQKDEFTEWSEKVASIDLNDPDGDEYQAWQNSTDDTYSSWIGTVKDKEFRPE